MFQYTLIVSQYYHSRHTFIVKHDENFIENAKKFTLELIAYKRSSDNKRPPWIGDLEIVRPEISPRYNVNDTGDIYFIQSDYANHCKDVAIDFREDSNREKRGFRSKQETDEISKHHDYQEVKRIVKKHFEIT